MAKNVICLWYDGTAEDAAGLYAQTFTDSAVTAAHRAPGDYPDGKQGQVLTVEFTVLGVPCLGLNGGPAFKHSEAEGERERLGRTPPHGLTYLAVRRPKPRAKRESTPRNCGTEVFPSCALCTLRPYAG